MNIKSALNIVCVYFVISLALLLLQNEAQLLLLLLLLEQIFLSLTPYVVPNISQNRESPAL
jgi:hypothetical protein